MDVDASVVVDAGGLGNTAGTPQLTFTFDTVAPEPTLTTAVVDAATLGYTNLDPITFTITFTDLMPFFDISHLTFTGKTRRRALGFGFGFEQSRWSAAERLHPTGRETMGSPTLQTLEEPILLLPDKSSRNWVVAGDVASSVLVGGADTSVWTVSAHPSTAS